MIEPTAHGRYRFHDLLRAYAADRAHRHDHADDRDRSLRGLFAWYAQAAHTCDELVFPAHLRLPMQPPSPNNSALDLDREQAIDWQEFERDNLIAVMHNAVRYKLFQYAIHLAGSLRFVASLSSSWNEVLDANNCGLEAAWELQDDSAKAYFLFRRGDTLTQMRRWDEAQIDFDRALATARTLGDRAYEGVALGDLGSLCCEREQFDNALNYLRAARPLIRSGATCGWRQ